MKTLRALTSVAAVASMILAGCDSTQTPTSATQPLAKTTTRSIAEFVAAQGTFCIDDGSGGCMQFVPPIDNLLGWASAAQGRFALVDYAGVADRYLRAESAGAISLGTTFDGSVTERELQDGRVLVSVNLRTDDALAWAIDSPDDWAGGTLLFGNRAQDVLDGATPSLVSSHLTVDFTLAHSGDPLPDLLQILVAPEQGQELRRVTFEASGNGELRAAYGVTDGTHGRLHVSQVGNIQSRSHSPSWDAFPVENVNLSVAN